MTIQSWLPVLQDYRILFTFFVIVKDLPIVFLFSAAKGFVVFWGLFGLLVWVFFLLIKNESVLFLFLLAFFRFLKPMFKSTVARISCVAVAN